MNESELKKAIETQLQISFKNTKLLQNAFVHRSYLNENRKFDLPSNERLEFLGDACLELVISEFLFERYPNEPEGKLTNYRSALVNTTSLAETSRDLNLGTYLLLSNGEEDGGGRTSEQILANTFEAFLGALYLDQGYEAAKNFVHSHLSQKIVDIIDNETFKDPKSKFQEITQAEVNITPVYNLISETGPDHNKVFTVKVRLGSKEIAKGQGGSKQKAELDAAKNALNVWDEVKNTIA